MALGLVDVGSLHAMVSTAGQVLRMLDSKNGLSRDADDYSEGCYHIIQLYCTALKETTSTVRAHLLLSV